MKCIAGFVLLIWFATAQEQPAKSGGQKPEAAETDPKDLCRVEGAVLNVLTSEKVRKANLNLISGMHRYAASSGSDGDFVFEKVEPGTYRLEADRPGFVRDSYGAKHPGQIPKQLTLTAGQNLEKLDFRLTPTGSITGRVTDEEGDPVAGATVQTLHTAYTVWENEVSASGYATTDDDGVFKISNVTPGGYYVRVSPQQKNAYASPLSKVSPNVKETEYVATYFPGGMDLSAASLVNTKAGETSAGIDIRLRKTGVFRIKGKITAEGNRGQSLLVQAYRAEAMATRGIRSRYTMSKPDGTFEMGELTPGGYTLSLSPTGGTSGTLGRQKVVIGDKDVDGVVIAASGTPVSIKGSVTIAGDKPPNLAGIHFNLVSIEEPPSYPQVITKDDGTFAINVDPNRYKASVFSLPDGTYLQSITLGDRDAISGVLDLNDAQGDVRVVLSLSRNSAQLELTVQDDKRQPVEAATLLLTTNPLNDDARRLRIYGNRTAKTGSATLKNIAPGKYYAFAFEYFNGQSDLGPDFLKKFVNKAAKLDIEPNGKATASLQLISDAESEAARRSP